MFSPRRWSWGSHDVKSWKEVELEATRLTLTKDHGSLTPSHADLSRKLLSAWLGCASCVTSRHIRGTQAAWADCVTLSAGQAGWHHENNILGRLGESQAVIAEGAHRVCPCRSINAACTRSTGRICLDCVP